MAQGDSPLDRSTSSPIPPEYVAFPSQVAYQDALQNPVLAFADPILRTSVPMDFAVFGLPVPISGQFANVYRMQSPDERQWAVKLFLRYLPGRTAQYQAVQLYLQQTKPAWAIPFAYHPQGIFVDGRWYPLLQMPWLTDAVPLNEFIAKAIGTPISLQPLLESWRTMIADMIAKRFAHGDLQHGNVFVSGHLQSGAFPILQLIDYDAAFIPVLTGASGAESGHPAYQHPLRTGADYSLFQDRFSAIAIATALLILIRAPELWYRFDNGDNILFRREDFTQTDSAGRAFALLERYPDAGVRHAAKLFRVICENPLQRVPDLERFLHTAQAY